jgi:hypothetical protein
VFLVEELNKMVEKHRLRLTSESIVNAAPIVESFPGPRRTGEPPLIVVGDEKHYMYTASAFRGKTRRRVFKNIVTKMRKIRPEVRFSSADVRLMMIGGVKASGRSDHLSPIKTEQVRELRPDLEIYGMNDPTFLGGCLLAGMMVSVAPIRTDRVDPDSTIPIIRRSLLNDAMLHDVPLSDDGSMQELSELNHQRSKVEAAIKVLARLERKERNARDDRVREQVLATLMEIAGRPIASADEAEHFLLEMREKMKQDGFSDVSEANIQTAATIPAGTPMRHLVHLHQISTLGAGLFLWGLHDAWCFDPMVGGMSARGAGGYLTMVYNVDRQEGYNWVHDCKIQVEPDLGVKFMSNHNNSLLQSAFEEWRKVDITKYDFSFDSLKTFIGAK